MLARPLWCCTCGAYVRPGSHGIHEVRYGAGPVEPSAPERVSGAVAVAYVLSFLLAFVLVALLAVTWTLRSAGAV